MIKLFRKIRQRLITQNKFSKYLLYAIGEIVLVVIGILIALSVNNWNESYKVNKNIATLLKDYRADLVMDTLMLSAFIDNGKTRIETEQKNISRMSGPNATLDTVKHIAKYEHDPFINIIEKYSSKNTFNSMIGTSAFKLLDQVLKRKILNLDVYQTITLNEKMINQYFELTREYTLDYPFGDNLGSGYLNEISWKIQNERDFVVKYTAMCTFKTLLIFTKINSYTKAMQLTKQLISELD